MENYSQSRRYFVKALGALLAGGFLVRFLQPNGSKKRRELLRVRATDVPVEGALVYRDARIALIHDPAGISALSLICTHLGCTVQVTSAELACPCHGSLFNRQGEVLKGPAPRPLERLPVEMQNEHLVVYETRNL